MLLFFRTRRFGEGPNLFQSKILLRPRNPLLLKAPLWGLHCPIQLQQIQMQPFLGMYRRQILLKRKSEPRLFLRLGFWHQAKDFGQLFHCVRVADVDQIAGTREVEQAMFA